MKAKAEKVLIGEKRLKEAQTMLDSFQKTCRDYNADKADVSRDVFETEAIGFGVYIRPYVASMIREIRRLRSV